MKILSLIIPCVAFATAAHGALLLQENFEGLNTSPTDDQNNLNGQNGWTAGAALDVAAGGLSYSNGSLSISGGSNHATWTGANSQPLGSKTFATQSGDVWFSLTFSVTTTDTSNRFWFYVSDDADLGDSGVVGQINNNSGALLGGSRIGSTQTATSTGISLTNTANQGVTFFVVGRFSQSTTGGTSTVGDYDRMDVWVNPDSTALGGGFASISTTGAGITSGIDTFAISALGTGASTVLWDNLRVGTTQADVLNVYAIPEPSAAAALAGLGALGVAALRRRRVAH